MFSTSWIVLSGACRASWQFCNRMVSARLGSATAPHRPADQAFSFLFSRPSVRAAPALCAAAGLAVLALALPPGTAAAQDSTLPTVSVSDAEVDEDGSWMTFRVYLSAPSDDWVTVDYVTSSGTATRGTDFRAESPHAVLRTMFLTFDPGATSQVISVMVHDDSEIEEDETFTLTLKNPTGATLGDATATGTIKDDDTAATLTASDVGETTATLTISGHTQGWWYKGRAHPCTAVPAGTTTVDLSDLTTATGYRYLRVQREHVHDETR